jgi:general secretion pathway protein A
MYTAFFGFKEIPFSISPNPHFLFMSDRHREALSHLTYALGDQGGFVLLTGEVGTGKTTISRRLMEQLPDNVQRAFILNPTLSSQELLATICDELEIAYDASKATLKSLTDAIQKKLIQNHENNINTLLIIDEAQHLRPDVLEQLRLLTNLETDVKKLLKVILIGQPELQDLLKRRDLRQLAQRITARYHLLPLNKQEVAQYVTHRLSVVQCSRDIFKANALVMIHQLTQGIPRLINLLCDRALMHAYNNNDSIVTRTCIINAAEEALGEKYIPINEWKTKLAKAAMMSFALFITFWLGSALNSDGLSIFSQYSLVKNASINRQVSYRANEQVNKALTDIQSSTESPEINVSATPEFEVKNSLKKEALAVKPTQQTPLVEDISPVKEVAVSKKAPVVKAPAVIDEQVVFSGKTKASSEKDITYKVNPVEGVSDDMLARFQSALDESIIDHSTDNKVADKAATNELAEKPHATVKNSSNENTATPDWAKGKLKGLDFQMHIYASDGNGWIRVNGEDVFEGEAIANKFTLTEILPQSLVLSYQGESFNVPALSSW